MVRSTDCVRRPAGLAELLAATLPAGAEVEVQGRGNLRAVLASLLGLAVDDLGRRRLEPDDWRYPVVVLARVRRPPAAASPC